MLWFWWFRIRGTVIKHIWWEVVLLMLYTAGVVAINEYGEIAISFGQALIPVLGTVLGLLIGFRSGTGYARYEEGRALWAQMTNAARAMALNIWGTVRSPASIDIVEKKTAINLCIGFVIAVKHYLREEYAYDYPDLKHLVAHLEKYGTPSSTVAMEDQAAKSKGRAQSDLTDHYEHLKAKHSKPFKLMAYDCSTPTNIPVEIICYLNSYLFNHVMKNELVDMPFAGSLFGGLDTMTTCLTEFERIARTPIPLAYSVHLHHCVWLYLLAVPFQFIESLGWYTVIIVGVAAFCMLGILSIGVEIENPFGYDDNDLPLDDFCEVLQQEFEMITGQGPLLAPDWLDSPKNRPFNFASQCKLTSMELGQKSAEDVRRILSENALARQMPLDREHKQK